MNNTYNNIKIITSAVKYANDNNNDETKSIRVYDIKHVLFYYYLFNIISLIVLA